MFLGMVKVQFEYQKRGGKEITDAGELHSIVRVRKKRTTRGKIRKREIPPSIISISQIKAPRGEVGFAVEGRGDSLVDFFIPLLHKGSHATDGLMYG
jgi:hypothetical protein